MRIFLHHDPGLILPSETIDAVGRFTHQQIKILIVALAALSCLVLGVLMYRSYTTRKIEKQSPNQIIIPIQTQKEPPAISVCPAPPALPPEAPAKKPASVSKEQIKVKAKAKDNADTQTKQIAAPSEPIHPAPIAKSISITLSNGDVWEGISPDCCGEGKMKKRGETHEGNFLNGKLHGQGKITDSYHEIKEGLFDNGIFIEGKISHKFPKRVGSKEYHNYWEGTFKNDLLNGRGKKVEYHLIEEGDFADGELNGHGKIIFEDGISWEGTFIQGKFNGHGSVAFCEKNRGKGNAVLNPAVFQEIVLILEFMLPTNKKLTDINICVGGIKEPLPKEHCLYVYETIKGFAKLNESLDDFKQLLSEEGLSEIFRAKHIQEFAFHKENSATLIPDIEHTLRIFAEQYLLHKAQETLTHFLMEAFNGEEVCFEARSHHLLTYHATHLPSIS